MISPKYRKGFFILFFIICLLVSSLIYLRNPLLRCFSYECLSFPDKNLWKIEEIYQKENTMWRGLFIHPEYLVRLEHISRMSPEKSTEFTKIRLMQSQGLFDTARSPYPGIITDKVTCDEKYKPNPKILSTVSGTSVTYYSAFLNDRLQYGSCTEDQIVHVGHVALFYCAQTNDWYQLELIVPREKAKTDSFYLDLFHQISCQRPSLNTGRLSP